MIYSLQIRCEEQDSYEAVLHIPVTITTITQTKTEINDNELKMVEEAFAKQLKPLLILMST